MTSSRTDHSARSIPLGEVVRPKLSPEIPGHGSEGLEPRLP